MAVDLEELVPFLKSEVATPGNEETTFPSAETGDWVLQLQNAFWQAYLDGMVQGYNEADGIVSPRDSGADDMPRDLQQLLVLYAGITVVRNQLRELNTRFAAKAGPVEYETEKSAQVLVGLLNELQTRRNIVLERLSDLGLVEDVYIDAVQQRLLNVAEGLGHWTAAGY